MSDAPPEPSPDLHRIGWMAWLFIVGSACFAIGAPLTVWDPSNPVLVAVIFFVGSIFFTSAATIQLMLARTTLARPTSRALRSRVRRLVDVRNPAWTSAGIQWFGTLAFNATTFRSVLDALDEGSVTNQAVWRPDAIGSVLFLVSSAIACMPEVRRHRHGHARDRSWLISALNMVGSIFFGLSAIGAYTLPESDELLNEVWANAGTFLGALGFLSAAWLLLPRRTANK